MIGGPGYVDVPTLVSFGGGGSEKCVLVYFCCGGGACADKTCLSTSSKSTLPSASTLLDT